MDNICQKKNIYITWINIDFHCLLSSNHSTPSTGFANTLAKPQHKKIDEWSKPTLRTKTFGMDLIENGIFRHTHTDKHYSYDMIYKV